MLGPRRYSMDTMLDWWSTFAQVQHCDVAKPPVGPDAPKPPQNDAEASAYRNRTHNKTNNRKQATLLRRPLPPSFNMSGNNISVFLTAKQLQDIVITCALSTGLYGINVALSVSCLHLLIVTRGHLQYHPTKVVAFYIYILGMLGFATQAAVNVFQYFPGTVAMVNGQLKTSGLTFALVMRDGPIPQEAAISLPFIILGYVLFMVRINPIGSHIKLSETFRYGDAIHCIEVLGE